jgi:hypothetical protein
MKGNSEGVRVPVDYLRFQDFESYLFEDVHRRFQEDGSIGAFDFFAIVIWKANRAKSKVAQRLLDRDAKGRKRLEPIVRDLTRSLHEAPDARSRLRILREDWGFQLPMASAVLSVLWPDEFTVYDARVCGQLGRFGDLAGKGRFDVLWDGYCQYLKAVEERGPAHLSLRQKDRFLWGKSVAEQLARDVGKAFKRPGA